MLRFDEFSRTSCYEGAYSTAVVVVVVEASTPKVYPRVTLVSASTLSGSIKARETSHFGYLFKIIERVLSFL